MVCRCTIQVHVGHFYIFKVNAHTVYCPCLLDTFLEWNSSHGSVCTLVFGSQFSSGSVHLYKKEKMSQLIIPTKSSLNFRHWRTADSNVNTAWDVQQSLSKDPKHTIVVSVLSFQQSMNSLQNLLALAISLTLSAFAWGVFLNTAQRWGKGQQAGSSHCLSTGAHFPSLCFVLLATSSIYCRTRW